jgi:hypothetical protein
VRFKPAWILRAALSVAIHCFLYGEASPDDVKHHLRSCWCHASSTTCLLAVPPCIAAISPSAARASGGSCPLCLYSSLCTCSISGANDTFCATYLTTSNHTTTFSSPARDSKITATSSICLFTAFDPHDASSSAQQPQSYGMDGTPP